MAEYEQAITLGVGLDDTLAKKDAKELSDVVKKTFAKSGTKEQTSQQASLNAQIRKTIDNIKQVEEASKRASDIKTPTAEFTKAQGDLKFLEKEYDKIVTKLSELEIKGKTQSEVYRGWQDKLHEVNIGIDDVKEEMQSLVEEGKAFIVGDPEKQAKLETQLAGLKDKLTAQLIKHREINDYVQQESTLHRNVTEEIAQERRGVTTLRDEMQRMLDSIKQSLTDIPKIVPQIGQQLSAVFSKVGPVISNMGHTVMTVARKGNSIINSIGAKLKGITKHVHKTNKALNGTNITMKSLIRNVLKWGFGIRSAFILVRRLRAGIKEGLSNLFDSKVAPQLTQSIEQLKASLLTLKNAWGAAFAPILSAVLPYVQQLVAWLTKLANIIAQLTSALFGKSSYIKAVDQMAKSTGAAAGSAKELNKQLASFDKLNTLSTKDNSGGGADTSGMFKEVPVDPWINDLAKKIKQIASDLFAPIKEAWNREKDFVISSWKKAVESMKKLAGTIWDDFIEVWKQEATIKIFQDLFHIIGDIGLIVANLADRFREAWEYNKNGKKILEAIRDIIGIIVHGIREAADYTVEWTKNLNFTPLLDTIRKLFESLKQPIQAVTDVLVDFYEMVILKFAKFLIEDDKGLQALLQVFIDFNNEVDWDGLRNNLQTLWEHLEPFIRRVWEGLVEFINELSDGVRDFVNSQGFKDSIDLICEALDNISAEDAKEFFKWAFLITAGVKLLSAIGAPLAKAVGFIVTHFKQIQAAFASAKLFFATNPEMLVAVLDPIVENFEKWIGEKFPKLSEFLGHALITAIGAGIGFAAGGPIGALIGGLIGFLADQFIVQGVKLKTVFSQILADIFNWNYTKSIFEDAKKQFEKGGGYIILGIIEGIYGAISWLLEPIADVFLAIYNHFCEAFGINSPAEKMKPIGENIVLGVYEGIKSIISSIKSWITENIFTPFIEAFKSVFGISSPSTVMQEQGHFIMEGLLQGITDKVKLIIDKFIDLKNKITTELTNTKNKIIEIANAIWSGLKRPLNAIIAGVEKMANSVIQGINKMIEALNELHFDIPDWVPKIGGNSFGISIPTLSSISIPRLAQGGVVPPNKEFMAMLGDNKTEEEIVSPLSTMKQAFLEALQESGMSGGGGDIRVDVDGDTLFTIVRKHDSQYKNMHGGKSAFAY